MFALQTFLAILPGILIAIWIFHADKYEKEPLLLLLLCFIAGMGTIFPAVVLEQAGMAAGIDDKGGLFETFVFAFGVIATSEELVKLIAVLIFAYPWKAFNEPMDGIVYGVMVAMGFATLENVLYSNMYGMDTVILRAITAVPAHAAFGIFMGYHVGLAKFNIGNRGWHFFLALSGPVLFHGAYDFFLFQQSFPQLTLLAFVTLAISIYYTRQLIRLHNEESPFKDGIPSNKPDIATLDAEETDEW